MSKVPDDSHWTSTEDRLALEQLRGVKWWEDRMKPSRQRGLTQSQRDSWARCLRAIRRERFLEAQSEPIE
jgi:hypothetical protein